MIDYVKDCFDNMWLKIQSSIAEEVFNQLCKQEDEEIMRTCAKCGESLPIRDFWKGKHGSRDRICIECIKAGKNPYDAVQWVDEFIYYDIPFIKWKWDEIAERCKEKGQPAFGKYLATMKLKGFKDYSWRDSKMLNDLARKKGWASPNINTRASQENRDED